MTKTYRFDYTVTAHGKSRSAIKTVQAYAWNDAARRLGKHAGRKWFIPPTVIINNAEVDGVLINPDLLPQMNEIAQAAV